MLCGLCGSNDIFSGSWVPDRCRDCGAIEGPDNWYLDEEDSSLIKKDTVEIKHIKNKA